MERIDTLLIKGETLAQFVRILEVIKWNFPGSHPVIGGGALRDAILGGPIKDVDVFMRRMDHPTLDTDLTTKVPTPSLFLHYGRPDMHGAWDFQQRLEGYPVQLILADFDRLDDLANTFDLNMSRITFDGEELYVTEAFVDGFKTKTFRILRADNDYEVARSLKRIERMLSKYPEFIAA